MNDWMNDDEWMNEWMMNAWMNNDDDDDKNDDDDGNDNNQ